MPADLGPPFFRSHMLYDKGAEVLVSPHLLLCCCCRTNDRTDKDESLTKASLKVMEMSSDRSSGLRPAECEMCQKMPAEHECTHSTDQACDCEAKICIWCRGHGQHALDVVSPMPEVRACMF